MIVQLRDLMGFDPRFMKVQRDENPKQSSNIYFINLFYEDDTGDYERFCNFYISSHGHSSRSEVRPLVCQVLQFD